MNITSIRRTLLTILLLLAVLPTWSATAGASAPEPPSGSVVCPPGIYPNAPSDCLPLGPSQSLAQSAAEGLPWPLLPLPAWSPVRSLADLPFQYFKVTKAGEPLFSSLDDAIANHASKILLPSDHLYVSYDGITKVSDQASYYHLTSGYWVFAEGGRLGKYDPPFQGLQFSSPPRNAFGWVLGETRSRTAPGLNSPETGKTWYRFNVIQIYATKDADGLTWVEIGQNEWLDSRNVSRVDPHSTPPQGVSAARRIEVNLFEQTVSVYDNNRLVFATIASTGVERFWTRPGIFQIQKKLDTETMSNSVPGDFYYLEDVPWTMYFDEARAFHGAYWHQGFGYPRSHGCVNLSIGDSHWLYDWAKVGDTVYVYDPSGKTPTDPALFGSGAP